MTAGPARVDALVVAATAWEIDALRRHLGPVERAAVGPWAVERGRLGGAAVALLAAGLGKANVALALGAVTERVAAGLILSVGVGGAFPGSGLEPGDLAVASEEVYADEGAETAEGWQGLDAVGIPLWEAADGGVYLNRLPVDPAETAGLAAAARAAGRAAVGPFVTVSTVTGSAARAAWLRERFGAVCETMEGAAAAHAALARGVPFAEVRGISNAVGPRDRASWRLAEAAAAAQGAALAFLEARESARPR